jgi:hypothetical protein
MLPLPAHPALSLLRDLLNIEESGHRGFLDLYDLRSRAIQEG